jgi:hypothetical protein
MFGPLPDVAQHLDEKLFGIIDSHWIFLYVLPIGPRSAMSEVLLLDRRAEDGLRLFIALAAWILLGLFGLFSNTADRGYGNAAARTGTPRLDAYTR